MGIYGIQKITKKMTRKDGQSKYILSNGIKQLIYDDDKTTYIKTLYYRKTTLKK